MATNIRLIEQPQLWNSCESDITYKLVFKDYLTTSIDEEVVSSVGTGYPKVNLSDPWNIIPVKNEYIYILNGVYAGRHRVRSATSTTCVIDTPYVGISVNSRSVKHLRVPSFKVYKGFNTGEEFPVELPYTLVTSFSYTYNQDIEIVLNIKAILKRIFKIEPPSVATAYDFSVFNAFRISFDDIISDKKYVLNSAITTDELNTKYISGAYYLTNVDEPLIWGCGETFITRFKGFPALEIYNGGNKAQVGFNNAFQTNQFSQGFDIL